MECCLECFADRFLIAQVEALGAPRDECPACGHADALIVETAALADYFSPLLDLYTAAADGEPLHRLLQADWRLFAVEDEARQEELIQAILRELGVEGLRFKVAYEPSQNLSEEWEAFSAELKSENRFLPNSAPDAALFAKFGASLGVIFRAGQTLLFRARINEDGHQFEIKDLQKPPADIATNGRANPLGIPYLYVASDSQTAIAEVRGHKGDRVTVVQFEIMEDLDLYDLRAPRSTVSPFEQLDDIRFVHEHLPYFELLGSELSKPITPKKANLEYLPSQYLCEVIKKNGHHGILYGSSIAAGFNCVVFADEKLRGGPMLEYAITEMTYATELIREVE